MFILLGCDFESVLIIENNRSEPIRFNIEGTPPYEYGPLKLIREDGNKYVFELEKESQHTIVQLINMHLHPSNIPISKLVIVTSADTIVFEDENAIFNRMETITKDYFKIAVQ